MPPSRALMSFAVSRYTPYLVVVVNEGFYQEEDRYRRARAPICVFQGPRPSTSKVARHPLPSQALDVDGPDGKPRHARRPSDYSVDPSDLHYPENRQGAATPDKASPPARSFVLAVTVLRARAVIVREGSPLFRGRRFLHSVCFLSSQQ